MCYYQTFSIMCFNLFQIHNLCQFWSKSGFSQKNTHTAFSFLFPSILLSCYHQINAKSGIYFAQPSFCIFERCESHEILVVQKSTLFTLTVSRVFFWLDLSSFRVNVAQHREFTRCGVFCGIFHQFLRIQITQQRKRAAQVPITAVCCITFKPEQRTVDQPPFSCTQEQI